MAMPAEYFADARNCMVDSQIRPNRVTDPRILTAMRRLPRERFLPPEVQSLSYVDEDVPLGNGRYMMEPMVLAKLVQAAALFANERVLVIAAGTGYGAAVIAACGCRVTALEEDPALVSIARATLAVEAPAVTLVTGSLAAGWPAGAPYDLILIEGAVGVIPPGLAGQLHQETGRLLTPIRRDGGITQAVRAEAIGNSFSMNTLFDCGTPEIPSLKKTRSFAF